jgi:parvulin-like peptidyl-prolyl isomerase
MIASDAVAGVDVDDGALAAAKNELLQQRGFESIDQWSEMLADLDRTDEEVIDRLELVIRRQEFIRERFAPKAEARFLERKNELDQVVYSLLRLANNFLARELYLQIESGESNFADLAKRYAEGPERNTNGIVGPVSLTQAHPALVEKLRVAQPGVLLEPFRIADWWLVVRLERYSPATFTPEVSDRMCREMFDAWIAEETATTLSRLEGEFSDFSIS